MTSRMKSRNLKLPQSQEVKLARDLLSELLALMMPAEPEGVQYVNGDIVGHDRRVHALASVLQSLLPVKYGSFGVVRLVEDATFELCRAPTEEQTLETLYERFASDSNGPDVRGIAYGFLNIGRGHTPEKLELAGMVLTQTDSSDLFTRVFSKERLEEFYQLHRIRKTLLQKSFQLVPYRSEISVAHNDYSGSFINSVAQVIRPLNTVRALLNLVLTYGRAKWHYGIEISRLSVLWPSPVTFVEKDGVFEPGYVYESTSLDASSISTVNLNESNWESVNALDRELQTMSSDVAHHLLILLSLHQKALDATQAETAFLHFWQVVERAVTPKQSGRAFDGNKIVSRLKCVMKLTTSHEVVLKEHYKIRNEYVHAGVFPDNDPDFYPRTMKLYAETIIVWLFEMGKEFPSLSALDAFFEIAPTASSKRLNDIDAAIGVTRKILESRERKRPK